MYWTLSCMNDNRNKKTREVTIISEILLKKHSSIHWTWYKSIYMPWTRNGDILDRIKIIYLNAAFSFQTDFLLSNSTVALSLIWTRWHTRMNNLVLIPQSMTHNVHRSSVYWTCLFVFKHNSYWHWLWCAIVKLWVVVVRMMNNVLRENF
jgi:hypothetical protein